MAAHQDTAWIRAIRDRAVEKASPTAEIVDAILAEAARRGTPFSLLAAHRLANGWTLADVADELTRLRAMNGATGRSRRKPVLVKTISGWEHGTHHPDRNDLDLLCRLFQTGADRLGFPAPDHTPGSQAVPTPQTQACVAVEDGASGPGGGVYGQMSDRYRDDAVGGLPDAVASFLNKVREGVDDVLEASMVADSTVERWERTTVEYAATYQTTPPVRTLVSAAQDLATVEQLREKPQPLAQKQRLTRVIAQLSGLIGALSINIGEYRLAQDWFHTARLAAEDIEDRGLRAWVLAHDSFVPFYEGNLTVAAQQAGAAETLAGNTGSGATVLAPALQARALSQLGDVPSARAAIERARTAFDRLGNAVATDMLYGYTERQLSFCSAQVWTYTRDLDEAEQAYQQARQLYASTEYLDPALMAFDAALRMISAGDPAAAAEHAAGVLASLGEGQRTGIIEVRARAVLLAIPPAARTMPAVESYREILAIGA